MNDHATGLLLDGRYRLGRVIGRGGMSSVYAAEDLQLSREVAVKILHGNPDHALAERLFREAKAAAQANHPAVITVFGYGSDDAAGVDYVIMERLHGEDLAARIEREGPQSITFVQQLGREIADALAAVHATSVVHRDLKPGNVFLAKRGLRVDEIKLLDFGIAKHLDLHTLTGTGEVIGSLPYMAPEQVRDAKRIGPQSDIYALGAVLYECLTGEPPFQARGLIELARRVLQGGPPPLSAARPDAPPALVALIERCLSLEPSERHPDARALCSELLAL